MELELKLEFDPADRERLELAPQLRLRDALTSHMVSVYFDTPARDLRQAGYSLRVRHVGRKRIQTVKAPGGSSAGLFARLEWEHPIKGDRPLFDGDVGPLLEDVGASVLGRLEAVFVTDVKRTVYHIESEGANIELAIDKGKVRAGDRSERLSEVELELCGGTPQSLFDLARQLNEQAPLRIGVRSKADRGFALAADATPCSSEAEPISLDPNSDASAAFCAIAQAGLRHFRINEAWLLQSGDAEALHQARVGLRRLRCAFSLCKRLFSDDGTSALLRAELRWLAAELGNVRNIDVVIAGCDGDARDRLAALRERTFAHVRKELASPRTRALMLDLTEWLSFGPWRTDPTHPKRIHQNVVPFAHDLLDRGWDRLRHRGKGFAGLDDAQRHRLRMEVKKFRYLSEFFGSLYTGGKRRAQHRRLLDAIEQLQDLLGELNDRVMVKHLLARHGIDAAMPYSGKRKRERLLVRTDAALVALLRSQRFWRK